MDSRSFDRLARLLGEATDRRAGLKAVLGGLLGAAVALDMEMDAEARKRRKADDAEADKRKKRKKTCKPACTGGYVCRKIDGAHQCVCETGVTCGAACCALGQVCEGGACVPEPQPTRCIAFGEPCKNVGKRCCDGLACGSGQDGSFPVACWKAAGAACASVDECGYSHECVDGVCTPVQQPVSCTPLDVSCGNGETCCDGLTCENGRCGTGGGGCAFPGTNLAFGEKCCESSQCTTGLCWYPQDSSGNQLSGSAGLQKVCRVATGGTCSYSANGYYGECGLGNECDSSPSPNVCRTGPSGTYPLRVPLGGTGCSATTPCAKPSDNYCNAGTCVARNARQLKDQCDPAMDKCPSNTKCTTYGVGSGAANTATTYCLGDPNYSPSSGTAADECASYRIYNSKCTEVCTVYLTSGNDNAARGAALKEALEAAAENTSGFPFVYIEPDTAGTVTQKYVTQEISLALKMDDAADGVLLINCFSTGAPKPVISGGWSGAADGNRILNVTQAAGKTGRFSIQRIDFEAGNANGDGGAIRISTPNATNPLSNGTTLTDYHVLRQVAITGSNASGNGGGLWVDGPISLNAVTVSGCTAGGLGGGVYNKTATNQYSEFSGATSITNNTASSTSDSKPGAGLYWDAAVTTRTICGTTMFTSSGSIASNVDAVNKMDCAYGTTAATFLNCGCGVKEQ